MVAFAIGFISLSSSRIAVFIAHFDHANGVVRTIVRARLATDARALVDDYLAAESVAVNRAGRAANHANRVRAMHAGIGDHDVPVDRAVAQETRIVVVRGRAGAHAIVATRATIQINHHRRRAVEKAILRQKLHHVRRRFCAPASDRRR